MLEMYTDGSCKMSTRQGGWAWVLVDGDEDIHSVFGIAEQTTNNIMELTALIDAITYAITTNIEVTIFTDSKYCCDGYNDWCFNWEKKRWKTSTNKKVENLELWQKLHKLRSPKIIVKWVKGHDGNKWNEFVDDLTREYENND